jgi:hypothetical protein
MRPLGITTKSARTPDRIHEGTVAIWAVGGAGVGFVLAWLARGVDPAGSVLSASAVSASPAQARGDRGPLATLRVRLLLAAVYVSMGVTNPLPVGVVPAVFGVAFGVLACIAARRELLLARLSLSVRSSDGVGGADIEVMGAASARFAARRAAEALGLPIEREGYRLERAGVPLDSRRSLAAGGIRSGDVLTLVSVGTTHEPVIMYRALEQGRDASPPSESEVSSL